MDTFARYRLAQNGEKMKNFRRFALLTTLWTYLLIFMGGLVRVSGAGLGCPDWPKCFGRWIPPTNATQLPPGIDPSKFNYTLAWIEYINRLGGVLLGILMVIAAVWVLAKYTKYLRILIPVLVAALLTAFQGWQGSVVVASQLEPIIVTVHMFLALVIVSLMIYATYEAYLLELSAPATRFAFPRSLSLWFGSLWLIALVQIILGTQIRSAIEVIQEQFPLESGAAWLAKVGAINHVHMTLGIILLALSWYVWQVAFRYKDQLRPIMRQATVGMVVIVTLQLVLGMLFILMGMSALRQVFHLWLASLYIGLTLLLYTTTRRREVES